MQKTIRSDSLKEIVEQSKEIINNSSNLLVTGLLRFWKSTTILNWAVRQPHPFLYVARTNATSDESIEKIEAEVLENTTKRILSCKGKAHICPKIRESLKDEEDTSYELIKIRHCYDCSFKPRKGYRTPMEIIDMIVRERHINAERLDEYYEMGVCPTEATLIALREFECVFMTYAWLRFIRQMSKGIYNKAFKDKIVIFDEARHLEEFDVSTVKVGSGDNRRMVNDIQEQIQVLRKIDSLTNFRRYDDYRGVELLIKPLAEFSNFLSDMEFGGDGDTFYFDKKDLEEGRKLLGQAIVSKNMLPSMEEREVLNNAAIRFLWLESVNGNTFYLDKNDSLYLKEDELILTARAGKDDLLYILESSKQNILIDSTPPPLKWMRMWLGDVFDMDILTFLPESKPDIKVWVENRNRYWTQVFKHEGDKESEIGLIKGMCPNDEEWVISVRSRMERTMMRKEGLKHKVIYQRGTESEGVQLQGNHLLTGIQYIHSTTFASQRKLMERTIGNFRWNGYLMYKSIESFVQQMFRTVEAGKSMRMVMLGTTMKEVNMMKHLYPFLEYVDFQEVLSKGELNEDKIMEVRHLIETGQFASKEDIVRGKILELMEEPMNVQELSNSISREYRIYVKKVVDEMVKEHSLDKVTIGGVLKYTKSRMSSVDRFNVRKMFPYTYLSMQEGDRWSPWMFVDGEDIVEIKHKAWMQKKSLAVSMYQYMVDDRKEGVTIGDFVMDFDSHEDVQLAKDDSIKAIDYLNKKYGIDKRSFKIAFSGSKGFLVVLPLECFWSRLYENLHRVYHGVASEVAEVAPTLDLAVYKTRARLVRPANTYHPNGRVRIELSYRELCEMSMGEIIKRSYAPKDYSDPYIPEIVYGGFSKRLKEISDELIYLEEIRKSKSSGVFYSDKEYGSMDEFPDKVRSIIEGGEMRGSRNSGLCSLVGTLKSMNVSDKLIWQATERFAQNCSPSYPDALFRKTVSYLLRNR